MTCPVCAYPDMPYPPRDYNICPCCGTEFGNDDAIRSHEELRAAWVGQGATWFFGAEPEFWNPWTQLINAGFGSSVPVFAFGVQITADAMIDGLEQTYRDTDIPGLAVTLV